MSTLSMHPVEYFRLHLSHAGIRVRSLGSLARKVFECSEQATTVAVVLLVAALVVMSCVKIGTSASLTAIYKSTITEMVHPPLESINTVL